ncbi:M14 family metallopeptidase [Longimicrobium sp.]|uniref:M14 family metallopeptidase n=1 Tax=Longimicrobium sp. TaxID=2029185 RepID=UPI003B3ABE2D
MIRRTSVSIAATCAWLAGAAAGCTGSRSLPDPVLYPSPAIADSLSTRPERTGFRETSSYDEVVAYMRRAAALSPRIIHLTTFGTTNEGRPLPLGVVGRVTDASPAAVRASGKTVVYLQGNIHAGEVEGKEALQILLGDIPVGLYDKLFDELVLLVAPIYNADGNERIDAANRPRQHGPIGGMGIRPNAQGLDLNRDHTKLESPEARGLARMLTEYDPHVMIDLHTTNGTYHGYHLTYAPPLHPNTPPEIDRMLRREWLPAVTAGAKDAGWLLYYYGNVPSAEDGNPEVERGWYTFDHRPRFGTNYAGLRNRFGILSEAYSYLTFEERVRVTSDFVDRSLAWARTHAADIRRATEAADREDLRGRPLALNARLRREGPVTILMGEVREEANPLTGHMMLRRVDTVREERMPEWQSFDAGETERAPAMYLLPPGMDSIVDRLRMHGVRVDSVFDVPAQVEVFRIDSTRVAERAFQGHRERRVWGRWETQTPRMAPRMMGVPMDQPLARLVFTLLEPRSDDGFAAWNLLDRWIEPDRRYPIIRVPAQP